ncbi:hypothetical protein [Bifidobacterium longum]|uniref:hypothetical protein n=1 Tax=Bifidobacterium longum TaxID=216816 RepID=UPI002269A357|nr:hypothetical protein [Bifidobacterium longum]
MVSGVRDGSQDKGWNPAIRGRLVDGQGRCVHWLRHWMLLRIVSPAVTNITLATGAMMNWLDMIASRGETWIRSL